MVDYSKNYYDIGYEKGKAHKDNDKKLAFPRKRYGTNCDHFTGRDKKLKADYFNGYNDGFNGKPSSNIDKTTDVQ